ncbi:cytokine receptor-like factor 3 [Procambarus clarkii]|uniref:cytokine receptor-like factor 3 n=1 Tax=Procambarus clarkii TaxID=6728 RepID=UPI001E677FDE|nr:cytokine receptor-like factor 3 [Procambarus clarkii]XP_045600127.1 cytokine receptor-like factor 3 [Procambarus clarkii]XP_045600128.1 cytokine receptor-like factor 3 [Procambarus clarkii]XP_045600129.1 cytokine receptor-like factor 3 [Procambarus clarkii]XP_045600130.1 cytokine receptor-like factor 3 [Procambarus clarkii]
MSEVEEKASSTSERLREEYRRHVKTQISHDLVDTIATLEQHQEHLLQLCDQLKLAKKQVTNSASETKATINAVFDSFIAAVNESVNLRRRKLLDEVKEVEEEARGPLDQCENVLETRVREAVERIEQGKRLQQHGGVMAKDTVIRYQEEAAAMTSLPEVPALCAVPSVSVEFPGEPSLIEEVQDLIDQAGRVSRMGPVQITNIVEQPGALLVSWEEVDEDVSDDGLEFCFECSNTGATDHHTAIFHTKYVGPDYSFLLRDLRAGESYLLRVASRREGSKSFGPWSLVQSAVTNIPHYKWKSGCSSGWSIADDGRLASKVTSDLEVLHSDGPLLRAGSSVLFKVVCGGVGCSDEGLGLCCQPVTGPEQLLLPGALFLSAQGCVFLDGISRVTRLPAIQDKSQVSFAVEKVSSTKFRVYIESQEKQVTYEWGVPSAQEGLYFVATFGEARWKISVH